MRCRVSWAYTRRVVARTMAESMTLELTRQLTSTEGYADVLAELADDKCKHCLLWLWCCVGLMCVALSRFLSWQAQAQPRR